MKLSQFLLSVGAFLTASSVALTAPKPSLTVDEGRIEFVGNGCSVFDSFVSVNDNGSFDLLFTDLFVESRSNRYESRVCAVKFPLSIPKGYRLQISQVGVAGVADIRDPHGQGIVTLRHTLSGTVGDAATGEFYPQHGVQDIVLNKSFKNEWSKCNQSELEFKSTITVRAKGANSLVAIDEAAHNGKIRYYWKLTPCR